MKKIQAVLLISVLCLGFLGCEKKKRPGQGVVPAGQQVKLQVWTARDQEFLEALGKEFVTATKIPGLSIHVVPFKDEMELQRFLIDKMAENAGPDIVYIDGQWIVQNRKKLQPLENDPIYHPQNYEKTFVRAASEILVADGKVWGVPLGVDTLALFYNVEHLIDHLTDRNEPAETWKEFRKDVESLSQQDNSFERFSVSGVAMGRVDNIHYGLDIMQNIMLQMGVQTFTPDGSQVIFSQNQGVSSDGEKINFVTEAINFYTSFADARYKNFSWSEFLATPTSEYKNFETFAKGKVSMIFGYSQDYQIIKNMLEGGGTISENNFRVAPMPQYQDPRRASSKEIIGRVRAMVVPQTTKYSDLSWKFLKFAAKQENLRSYHETTGLPASRLDLIAEQQSEPHLGVFVKQAKFARPYVIPFTEEKYKQDFSALIDAINNNKTSAERGIHQLEEQWNLYLNDKIRRQKLLDSFQPPPPPEKPKES